MAAAAAAAAVASTSPSVSSSSSSSSSLSTTTTTTTSDSEPVFDIWQKSSNLLKPWQCKHTSAAAGATWVSGDTPCSVCHAINKAPPHQPTGFGWREFDFQTQFYTDQYDIMGATFRAYANGPRAASPAFKAQFRLRNARLAIMREWFNLESSASGIYAHAIAMAKWLHGTYMFSSQGATDDVLVFEVAWSIERLTAGGDEKRDAYLNRLRRDWESLKCYWLCRTWPLRFASDAEPRLAITSFQRHRDQGSSGRSSELPVSLYLRLNQLQVQFELAVRLLQSKAIAIYMCDSAPWPSDLICLAIWQQELALTALKHVSLKLTARELCRQDPQLSLRHLIRTYLMVDDAMVVPDEKQLRTQKAISAQDAHIMLAELEPTLGEWTGISKKEGQTKFILGLPDVAAADASSTTRATLIAKYVTGGRASSPDVAVGDEKRVYDDKEVKAIVAKAKTALAKSIAAAAATTTTATAQTTTAPMLVESTTATDTAMKTKQTMAARAVATTTTTVTCDVCDKQGLAGTTCLWCGAKLPLTIRIK